MGCFVSMSYNVNTSNRFASLNQQPKPRESEVAKQKSSATKTVSNDAKNKRNQENNNKNKKYNNERNNATRGRGSRGRGSGGRVRGRKFDRKSGTGRPGNEEKKSGHGKANWGGIKEHIEVEVLEQNEETPVENVTEEVEPKVQVITLEEFEKQRSEKEAKMEFNTTQRVVEVDDDLKEKFVVLDKK